MHLFAKRPIALEKQPRLFNYIFQVHFESLVTYHIVVPVVYWALLSSNFLSSSHDSQDYFRAISVHGLDFVLIYIDFALNKIPIFAKHVIFVIGIMLLYVFYTWILHAIPIPPDATFPTE